MCEEGFEEIHSRVFSRVGLLGNPSDGYGGKCISFSMANFSAEVVLVPSETVKFIPNPESDPQAFDSLESLTEHVHGCGYYGGVRLLMAMCKRFWEYCQDKGITLPAKNFSLSYSTTIPRQCGLSGSSAIALAALNCLMRFYGVEGRVPVEDRPALVLSAEQELGIEAGLQDRVIQVLGGLVVMDFDPEFMAEHGHGKYLSLDPECLPPLYVIYSSAQQPGKDSGKVHSYVKQRWLAGDPSVRAGMAQVAALVDPGMQALLTGDVPQLASLMRLNFRLRRQLYGDAALNASLKLVQVAETVGAAAKLTGSGGAAVVLCPDGAAQQRRLAEACAKEGLECHRVVVGPANVVAS